MREHKYRAYHDGKMVYDAAKVGNALYWNDGLAFDLFAFKQKNPAILMDYTGFKDITKKDIYEDDVLSVYLDGILYTSPVMFKHGCWVIYHPDRIDINTCEKEYINFGWWIDLDNTTIIGNIHEYPELIE